MTEKEELGASLFGKTAEFMEEDPLEEIFALNMGDFISEYLISEELANKIGKDVKDKTERLKSQLKELISIYSLDNTLCIPATIKENLSLPGYCRTQISVSLNEDGLLEILKASFGNHIIVAYGEVYQDFLPLLSLLRR